MNWFNKLLIAAIVIPIAQFAQAQQHCNAWFRGTLNIPINQKFSIDTELQHRRQNGLNNSNLLNKNLMFSYRNWLHFQQNDGLKFSLSPFAYFSQYKVIQKQEDIDSRPTSEIRFSGAIELQRNVIKKFYFVNRSAIEYRMFESNQADITRVRNRLGVRYDFTSSIKLSVYDELLFNVAVANQLHFFDHNRIGINVEYKVLPSLKLDVGYLHIARIPMSSTKKMHENNFFVNVTYQLQKRSKNVEPWLAHSHVGHI